MKRLLVLIFAAVLASAAAVSVSAVEAPEAAAAGGGYVKKCGGGRILLNADEKTTFAKHNKIRRDRGLKSFCVHPALQRAARAHSKDMIQRDYFAHGNVGKRLDKFGYNWRTYGENIGYNSTPDRMFDAWMESSGHRSNILNKGFREIGIGTYKGHFKPAGGTVTMYTADFGTR